MAREHESELFVDALVEQFERDLEVLWESSLVDGRPMFWLKRNEIEATLLKTLGPESLFELDRQLGQAGPGMMGNG